MIGGSEIFLILLAILLLFGADKIPAFARSLGKGLREIKKATDEIKSEITKETDTIKSDIQQGTDPLKQNLETSNPLTEIKDAINKEVSDIKQEQPKL